MKKETKKVNTKKANIDTKKVVPPKVKKKPGRKINTRKILDNAYESTVINTNKQEFKLDASSHTEMSVEEKIDYKLIYDEIESCILGTEFELLNKPDENNKFKKLNKADINKVYSHVIILKPTVSKIEIFSMLSEYFDISFYKFYDSLSNVFKQDLITELKRSDKTVMERIGGQLF